MIGVYILAVIGGLFLAGVVWLWAWAEVKAQAIRRDDRELDRRAKEADAMVKGSAADAAAMVRDWTPAPPARRELRNIPRGDGAQPFHADGLADALDQIRKADDRG